MVRAGLKKKSPKTTAAKKAIDAWQKRYFVLSAGELRYYKVRRPQAPSLLSRTGTLAHHLATRARLQSEKAAHMSNGESLKAISLEQILWATVNPRHPDAFVLDLGQERKVKLQAASEGERDAWVAAIEAAKLKHVPAWAGGENKGNNGRASAPSSATVTSARPFGTPLRESGVELVDARDPVAVATPGQIDVELLRTAGSKSQGCCVIS